MYRKATFVSPHEWADRTGAVAVATALCIAFTLLPVAVARFPALHDYPFHLARMLILTQAADPWYDRFYDVGTLLVSNAAMDAVVLLLAQLMPVEAACRLFVALTVGLCIVGTMVLHRAAHGRLSVWPLLAAVFTFNAILRYGFLNYLFSLGAALCCVAVWLTLDSPLWRRLSAFAFGVLLIFGHLSAFGVYAIIIAGIELQAVLQLRRERPLAAGAGRLFLSALPFVATLAVFVAVSRTAGSVEEAVVFETWLGYKPYVALYSLGSGILWLDLVTLAVLAALAAWLVWGRRLVLSPPLAVASVLLFLAFLAAPSKAMGSLFVDVRLFPALLLLLVATIDLSPAAATRRTVTTVLWAVCLLVALRGGTVAWTWIVQDRELGGIVASFSRLEPGAVVFAATAQPFPRIIADDDERRAVWQPPLKHVTSYAVLQAPVFVPMTYTGTAAHTLSVAPAYAGLKALQGQTPFVARTTEQLDDVIARIDAARRDWPETGPLYLHVVGTDRLAGWPDHFADRIVAQSGRTALLRIEN